MFVVSLGWLQAAFDWVNIRIRILFAVTSQVSSYLPVRSRLWMQSYFQLKRQSNITVWIILLSCQMLEIVFLIVIFQHLYFYTCNTIVFPIFYIICILFDVCIEARQDQELSLSLGASLTQMFCLCYLKCFTILYHLSATAASNKWSISLMCSLTCYNCDSLKFMSWLSLAILFVPLYFNFNNIVTHLANWIP